MVKNRVNVMFSIAGLHHGGAERVIASLCDHIDQDRFAISVCWWLGVGVIGQELQSKGVELIGLPELKPDVSPYLRFRVLRDLCKERSIDVIHTHDTGTLADAAQARLIGSKAKIVHTFHFGNYPHLAKRYLLMEMLFARLAHRLVAVGHEQAILVQKSLRLTPARLTTLYNGVGNVIPIPGSQLDVNFRSGSEAPVVLGSISTLTKQKGLPVLLDAASKLQQMQKDFVLLIVGDGPMRPELEQQAHSLGISDRVRFLGWIPNAASNVLHLFDVFCQSSLWEANSIVLLEAMSAGVPIVTTNVGESEHVIDDGVNGLVVPSNDSTQLAAAMANLIDDSSLRAAMGANAKSKFAKSYTVDRMVKSYESIYAELAML